MGTARQDTLACTEGMDFCGWGEPGMCWQPVCRGGPCCPTCLPRYPSPRLLPIGSGSLKELHAKPGWGEEREKDRGASFQPGTKWIPYAKNQMRSLGCWKAGRNMPNSQQERQRIILLGNLSPAVQVFVFLNSWKKIKRRLFCDMWKL